MQNISDLIRRVARGKHGAEHLTFDEARDIFTQLLSRKADPLQLGAFLIAQRMKGETADEIAGFTAAAREHIHESGKHCPPENAVDLPCYAGKRRAAPLHLAAALRAKSEGIPVLIHGLAQIEGRISAWDVLRQHGVHRAASLAQAHAHIRAYNIVYLDLADICPPLDAIIGLRPRLGVRSFANTVARLLNPLNCAGQLNGFFHTPYGELMGQANRTLGQKRSLLFMGAEGEPELYPARQKVLIRQQGETLQPLTFDETTDTTYPKEQQPLPQLQEDFSRIMAGNVNDYEKAALNRMQQAFIWAAGGVMPDTWRVASCPDQAMMDAIPTRKER